VREVGKGIIEIFHHRNEEEKDDNRRYFARIYFRIKDGRKVNFMGDNTNLWKRER